MPLSRITSPFMSATANVYSPSANTVAIRTSGSDSVVFNSSGNTGMGSASTTAAARLHVNETMSSNSAYHTALIVQGQPSSGTTGNSSQGGVQIEFRGRTDGAMANASIATIGAFIHTTAVNNQGGIFLRAAPTASGMEDLVRFSSSNDGSARMHFRNATMASNGTGITFPASQYASTDANTLDDYEEGTWTPTLSFNGSSTGITYGTQTAQYIKIGSTVFVNMYLYLSNKGTATGQAEINGFPFTAKAGIDFFIPLGVRGFINSGGNQVSLYSRGGNTTVFSMYQCNLTGSSNQTLTNSAFANSTELNFNFWYQASS